MPFQLGSGGWGPEAYQQAAYVTATATSASGVYRGNEASVVAVDVSYRFPGVDTCPFPEFVLGVETRITAAAGSLPLLFRAHPTQGAMMKKFVWGKRTSPDDQGCVDIVPPNSSPPLPCCTCSGAIPIAPAECLPGFGGTFTFYLVVCAEQEIDFKGFSGPKAGGLKAYCTAHIWRNHNRAYDNTKKVASMKAGEWTITVAPRLQAVSQFGSSLVSKRPKTGMYDCRKAVLNEATRLERESETARKEGRPACPEREALEAGLRSCLTNAYAGVHMGYVLSMLAGKLVAGQRKVYPFAFGKTPGRAKRSLCDCEAGTPIVSASFGTLVPTITEEDAPVQPVQSVFIEGLNSGGVASAKCVWLEVMEAMGPDSAFPWDVALKVELCAPLAILTVNLATDVSSMILSTCGGTEGACDRFRLRLLPSARGHASRAVDVSFCGSAAGCRIPWEHCVLHSRTPHANGPAVDRDRCRDALVRLVTVVVPLLTVQRLTWRRMPANAAALSNLPAGHEVLAHVQCASRKD